MHVPATTVSHPHMHCSLQMLSDIAFKCISWKKEKANGAMMIPKSAKTATLAARNQVNETPVITITNPEVMFHEEWRTDFAKLWLNQAEETAKNGKHTKHHKNT